MDETAHSIPLWEHYIEYIVTDTRDTQTKDFLASYYPGERMPKYSAQAALPRLNAIGAQGWELVHMEPVYLEHNGSVVVATGIGTNTYFCVFKRPIRRS